MGAKYVNVVKVKIKISCLKLNGNGNDYIDHLYDHELPIFCNYFFNKNNYLIKIEIY
jgi:hypothetical protein